MTLNDPEFDFRKNIYIPIGTVKKLVPNFFDKEKYVVHHENLQIYLRMVMKPEKYIVYQNLIAMAKTIFQHIQKE